MSTSIKRPFITRHWRKGLQYRLTWYANKTLWSENSSNFCHYPQDLSHTRLSKLSCEDFIGLLSQVQELKATSEKLAPILRENAITGRVLMYCELSELKSILQLNFGNWEIFKLLIQSLRDIESMARAQPTIKTEIVNDGASGSQQDPVLSRKKKSVIEKQVTHPPF